MRGSGTVADGACMAACACVRVTAVDARVRVAVACRVAVRGRDGVRVGALRAPRGVVACVTLARCGAAVSARVAVRAPVAVTPTAMDVPLPQPHREEV